MHATPRSDFRDGRKFAGGIHAGVRVCRHVVLTCLLCVHLCMVPRLHFCKNRRRTFSGEPRWFVAGPVNGRSARIRSWLLFPRVAIVRVDTENNTIKSGVAGTCRDNARRAALDLHRCATPFILPRLCRDETPPATRIDLGIINRDRPIRVARAIARLWCVSLS